MEYWDGRNLSNQEADWSTQIANELWNLIRIIENQGWERQHSKKFRGDGKWNGRLLAD